MDVITGFLIEGSLAKQYEYLMHLVENSTSEEEEMLAMSLRTAIAKKMVELDSGPTIAESVDKPSTLAASSLSERLTAATKLYACKEFEIAETITDNKVASEVTGVAVDHIKNPQDAFTDLAKTVHCTVADTVIHADGLRRGVLLKDGTASETHRSSCLSIVLNSALFVKQVLTTHQVPVGRRPDSVGGQAYTCDLALSHTENPFVFWAVIEVKNKATKGAEDESIVYGAHILRKQKTKAIFLLTLESTQFSCALLQRTEDGRLRRTALCTACACEPEHMTLLAAWLHAMVAFVRNQPHSGLAGGKSVFVEPQQQSYRLRRVVSQGEEDMYKVFDASQAAARALAAAEEVYRAVRVLAHVDEQAPATVASATELPPPATRATQPVAEEVPPACGKRTLTAALAVEAAAKQAVQSAEMAVRLRSQTIGSPRGSAADEAAGAAALDALQSAFVVACLRYGAARDLTVVESQKLTIKDLWESEFPTAESLLTAVFAAENATQVYRVNCELIERFYPGPVQYVESSAWVTVVKFRRVASPSVHLPKSAAQLRKLISLVHSVREFGFILGDLRPTNVLYAENGDVHLIDFDLARKISENANYPYAYATEKLEIPRHPDARPGMPMRAVHDIYALSQCLSYYARKQGPCAEEASRLAHCVNAAMVRDIEGWDMAALEQEIEAMNSTGSF